MRHRPILILANALVAIGGCHSEPGTPLAIAAGAGRVEDVRALLARGADPNEPDPGGWTPLVWAARDGQVEAARLLVAHGADPNLRDTRHRWTSLLHAIHKHQNGVVRALLDLGADVHADRDAALVMAAGCANVDVVRLLLDRGADPRARRGADTALVNAVGGAWDIDYVWTGCGPHTETVRALLDAAPDLALGDGLLAHVACATARRKGCTAMLQLLDARPTRAQC